MRDTILIPLGKCQCGCGQVAPVATRNVPSRGHVKGMPLRFVRGHATKCHDHGYDEQDRGYNTGCWIFRGYINPKNGYGYVGRVSAHRLYYERYVGPIDGGLELDHLCRQRSCVNPAHLEPVSHAENIRRSSIVGTSPKLKARRLTDADVRQIRQSSSSYRSLAREFGVSRETIRLAKNGTHYREVAQ